MADWKSGSAPPPRPVRREGAPPAPRRSSSDSGSIGEATGSYQAIPPEAESAAPEEAQPQTTAPVAATPTAPVVTPPVAPIETARPADVRPVESRRSSIFGNPVATPAVRTSPSASGSHRLPQIVSALDTAAASASAAPAQEPPAPPVAPTAPPVQIAPVQPAPVVTPAQTPSMQPAPSRRGSTIRSQKMALSLPVVITHPTGKEDTRTQFVISRGAVVFLSAPMQAGMQVNLKNPNNGKSCDCRVVNIERGPDGVNQVELEFMQPMPGFWPVHFPPEDWNPDERKRPTPTGSQQTAQSAPVKVTPAAAPIETKPVVTPAVQPAAVQPAKEIMPVVTPTPAVKPLATPARVAPAAAATKPVIVPVAEPVQVTPSVVASATAATVERAEKERISHHEPKTTPAAHTSVPTFGAHPHSGSSKKPVVYVVVAIAVVAICIGGWFVSTKVSAKESNNPQHVTPPAVNQTQPANANNTNPPSGTNNAANTAGVVSPAAGNTTSAPAHTETTHERETSRSSNNESASNRNSSSSSSNAAQRTDNAPPREQQITAGHGVAIHNNVASPSDNQPVAPNLSPGLGANALNLGPAVTPNVIQKAGRTAGATLISRVAPAYPQLAREKGIYGKVILQVQIDDKGNVSSVKAINGNPTLAYAAEQAVKKYKYNPAVKDDKPVPSSDKVTVEFKLSN